MARGMATSQKYDLHSHEFRATTHEAYARMREQTPVHRQPGLDGETPTWFVTRYDDVVAVLLDNEHFVLDPALGLTPDELRKLEEARLGESRHTCFPDSERLDFERNDETHVGFGRGRHAGSTSSVRPSIARTTTLVPVSQPPSQRALQISPFTFT